MCNILHYEQHHYTMYMLSAKYGLGPSQDFAAQTLDPSFGAIILGKPRIRGNCCANLESTRNHLGLRNQTSAIRGNKPTIDRASEAARPSAETKLQPIARAKQFDLLRQRSHKRSHTQSSSPIRGNEARSITQSRTHSGSAGNGG